MVQERKEEISGIPELPPSDSFNIPQYEDEGAATDLEEDISSNSTLEDPFSVEPTQDEVQEVSFSDGFNI